MPSSDPSGRCVGEPDPCRASKTPRAASASSKASSTISIPGGRVPLSGNLHRKLDATPDAAILDTTADSWSKCASILDSGWRQSGADGDDHTPGFAELLPTAVRVRAV